MYKQQSGIGLNLMELLFAKGSVTFWGCFSNSRSQHELFLRSMAKKLAVADLREEKGTRVPLDQNFFSFMPFS